MINYEKANNAFAKAMESSNKTLELFGSVNMLTLPQEVKDLISSILTTQGEFHNYVHEYGLVTQEILNANQATSNDAFVMSSFLDSKGLQDEFQVFEASFDVETKLAEALSLADAQERTLIDSIDAMANDSFAEVGFDGEISQEQAEASKKTTILYDAIKGGIPQELHKLLFDFNESFDDYTYVVAHEAYLQGFKEAVKSLNGNQTNG